MLFRSGHGLLITEKGHFKFFTKASEKIHALITTDPREVKDTVRKKRLEAIPKKKEGLKKAVEDKTGALQEVQAAESKSNEFLPTERWYSAKGRTDLEKKQLAGLGFVEINTTKHGKGGDTKYIVKPRTNESALHFFVCKVIEEDLKPYAEEIVLKETIEPDVAAKIHGKNVAFEVETGTSKQRGDKRVEEKFARVRQNYDDYFIVVTSRLQKGKYKKYGKVITRHEIVPSIKRFIAQLGR